MYCFFSRVFCVVHFNETQTQNSNEFSEYTGDPSPIAWTVRRLLREIGRKETRILCCLNPNTPSNNGMSSYVTFHGIEQKHRQIFYLDET